MVYNSDGLHDKLSACMAFAAKEADAEEQKSAQEHEAAYGTGHPV
jgi:hypothetical protein